MPTACHRNTKYGVRVQSGSEDTAWDTDLPYAGSQAQFFWFQLPINVRPRKKQLRLTWLSLCHLHGRPGLNYQVLAWGCCGHLGSEAANRKLVDLCLCLWNFKDRQKRHSGGLKTDIKV